MTPQLFINMHSSINTFYVTPTKEAEERTECWETTHYSAKDKSISLEEILSLPLETSSISLQNCRVKDPLEYPKIKDGDDERFKRLVSIVLHDVIIDGYALHLLSKRGFFSSPELKSFAWKTMENYIPINGELIFNSMDSPVLSTVEISGLFFFEKVFDDLCSRAKKWNSLTTLSLSCYLRGTRKHLLQSITPRIKQIKWGTFTNFAPLDTEYLLQNMHSLSEFMCKKSHIEAIPLPTLERLILLSPSLKKIILDDTDIEKDKLESEIAAIFSKKTDAALCLLNFIGLNAKRARQYRLPLDIIKLVPTFLI